MNSKLSPKRSIKRDVPCTITILQFYTMEAPELLSTRTGGTAILIDSYKFLKDKERGETFYWKCSNKSCKSRCTTDSSLQMKARPSDHNHPTPCVNIDRVRQDVKKRSLQSMNEPAGKIVCEEAIKHDELTYKEVTHLKNSVYRCRLKQRPPLPKTRQEAMEAISNICNETLDIMKTDHDNEIIMITSSSSLTFLCSCDHVLSDGTFKTCPKLFYQLYTFHGYESGTYVSCVYFLLPNKSAKTYGKMMKMLVETVTEKEQVLSPSFFHVDMEVPVIKTLTAMWPECKIRLCHFHVTQAWYRKIQTSGMANSYSNPESELGNWLKLFFALPSLRTDDVEDAFVFDLMSDSPSCQASHDFTDYMLLNYIKNDSKFPPSLWADLKSNDVTTTNACESFHQHFKKSLQTVHPNIYRFIDGLEEAERRATLKLRNLQLGATPNKKRKLAIDKTASKYKIIEDYEQGRITRIEFLKTMCKTMLPPRL